MARIPMFVLVLWLDLSTHLIQSFLILGGGILGQVRCGYHQD